MKNKLIYEKSYDLSVSVIELYKELTTNRREYIMSKKLLRCGTSVGALVTEAGFAKDSHDFDAKMHEAIKEVHEVGYWINLLKDTSYLAMEHYELFHGEVNEIYSLLLKAREDGGLYQ